MLQQLLRVLYHCSLDVVQVNTFKVGMHRLHTLNLDDFAINPSKFPRIPEEVLEYFLPLLQV